MLLSCPCVRILPISKCQTSIKHYTIIPMGDILFSYNMQTMPNKGYHLYLIWAFSHMAFHIYLVVVCTTGQDPISRSTQSMSKKGIPPSCSTQIVSKTATVLCISLHMLILV